MSTRPWLDNLVFAELADLVCVKTKPFAQNFICVLSKQRRWPDFRRAPAETHRPARHLELASDRVLHRLHDSALLEVCVLSQLHRVEDGAKFSTMTSAHFTIFLTRSRPRSDLRLMVRDFLLALNNKKYQESRFWLWLWPDCRPNKERPASPPCGFSILTTSAPSQASASVQDGPASNCVRSRTRIPARHCNCALFSVIRANSTETRVKRTIARGHRNGEQSTERVYRRRSRHDGDRHPTAPRGASGGSAAQPARRAAQGSVGSTGHDGKVRPRRAVLAG